MSTFQNSFLKFNDTEGGTFFTLSQYLEDLQRMITDNDLWKILPSTFSVYSIEKDEDEILELLNTFEEKIYTQKSLSTIDADNFKTLYEENLLNELFDEGPYYTGNTTLHSYSKYDTYGYSELVCHIPETAQYEDKSYFEFNSLVIFYDIYTVENEKIFSDIPLGIYITQSLEKVIKWSENSEYLYGTGTAYTLRLSSRFITGTSFETNIIDDSSEEVSYSQYLKNLGNSFSILSKKINEDIEKMYTDQNKIFYSLIKNNRINTPYVLSILGTDYWFINGRNTGVIATDITENTVITDVNNIITLALE